MLPLDLHVLSLSLAFILSQDQTLRCVLSSFLFFLCIKRCHEHTDGLPLIHNVTPHWWPAANASPGARPLRAAGRTAAAPLISPVTRNLDFGELRGILASLSLTCLSDFLIANMSMISHRLPGTPAAAL